MKQVIIVYSTDEHHTHYSKEMRGVAESHSKALKIANEWFVKQKCGQLSEHDITMLETQNQTQGRKDNIMFEAVTLNELQ